MLRIAALALTLSFTAFAIAQHKPAAPAKVVTPTAPPASAVQPATETLDLDTIARIRDEGLGRSHAMEYAAALFDTVGPRLTFSPDYQRAADWAVDQLRRLKLEHARTEAWGDSGMGWRQIGTSVQMMTPSTATVLAQATPWSPATGGEITGEVIAIPTLKSEKDFEQWKGKLAGRIVLYGDEPKIDPNTGEALEHLDAAKLQHLSDFPLSGDQSETYVLPSDPDYWATAFGRYSFKEQVSKFFADEHVAAALVPGGFNGVLRVDTSTSFGWFVFQPDHKQPIPSAVIASEAFGRMARLLSHKVPVRVRLNIVTQFAGEQTPGLNVIADLPGEDPALKDQVVMAGGHLDSWIGGTGATDNGAGVVIALEAMRILRALDLHPRRTIRIALWGGEEQGIYGSRGYVQKHLAEMKYTDDPKYRDVPQFLLAPQGISPKAPEYAAFDAYFNADNGTGRFLGIFAEGNGAVAHIFDQWAAPIRDLGFTTVSQRASGSTDHVNFDMAGLPGFQFIQDPRDYENRTHHTALDTYERLSGPDLKQAATVMAIFLWNASQRDAMLPRKPLHLETPRPLEGLYPAQ